MLAAIRGSAAGGNAGFKIGCSGLGSSCFAGGIDFGIGRLTGAIGVISGLRVSVVAAGGATLGDNTIAGGTTTG